MLDDGIADRNHVRADWMRRDGKGRRLVPLKRYGLILNEVEEGDLGVRAGEQHVGVELVHIDDVSVLVRV